uniref:Uncharacterized protein n=1 Tax=Rhizophora mucronata TaxID=61149 RepID=A0A2P2IH33_RHIMU
MFKQNLEQRIRVQLTTNVFRANYIVIECQITKFVKQTSLLGRSKVPN